MTALEGLEEDVEEESKFAGKFYFRLDGDSSRIFLHIFLNSTLGIILF